MIWFIWAILWHLKQFYFTFLSNNWPLFRAPFFEREGTVFETLLCRFVVSFLRGRIRPCPLIRFSGS